MISLNTWNRFREYGVKRFLLSADILLPLVTIILLWHFNLFTIDNNSMNTFVSASSVISGSLIGVILTGIAIIVALSNKKFLNFINKTKGIYDRLLFIFEYTVVLAIIVSVFGIILQTIDIRRVYFLIFLFLFSHLILSTFRVVSALITYGKKKAKYSAIQEIDSEDVELDLPDRLIAGNNDTENEESDKN